MFKIILSPQTSISKNSFTYFHPLEKKKYTEDRISSKIRSQDTLLENNWILNLKNKKTITSHGEKIVCKINEIAKKTRED